MVMKTSSREGFGGISVREQHPQCASALCSSIFFGIYYMQRIHISG